jgi:predicted Zn-dependent protease
MATVDQAAALNVARSLTGAASVGERMVGWYAQAGYDVLRSTRTGHQLVPYVRYERVNTQDRVPAGFAANPANDRRIVSLGGAWRPIGNIALKVDYQFQHNEARTGVGQLNANLSYLF